MGWLTLLDGGQMVKYVLAFLSSFIPTITAIDVLRSQEVACKTIIFDGTELGKAAINKEVAVLSVLRHQNIVEYYDLEWEAREARLYLEYCNAQNLDDYVKYMWQQ